MVFSCQSTLPARLSPLFCERWQCWRKRSTVALPDRSRASPDSALGSMSRQRMTVSTWRRPRSGFQSRLSTLKQISPLADKLGWKILVRK